NRNCWHDDYCYYYYNYFCYYIRPNLLCLFKKVNEEVSMYYYITLISTWIIPMFILITLLLASWRKIPAYELFVEGGREGIQMAISILPFLLGMIVAIAILRSSGALDAFIDLLRPFLSKVGVPLDLLPVAVIRPISGTAALAMTTELTQLYGPNSHVGRLAATMQRRTDTTLYILTVYFGAVGIKKMRYAL